MKTTDRVSRVGQMRAFRKRALQFAAYAAFAFALTAVGDEDDEAPANAAPAAPVLDAEQQHAVHLSVAHPQTERVPERTAALGLVLDPLSLISDAGERSVAGAQERSASAEAARLHALYQAGAGASLKMLEAAQAEEAKAQADVRFADARFAQHWGPLGKESQAAREKLLEALTAGRSALVRADLPGRHLVGTLPAKALLDVDGVEVPGRVLGALGQSGELQSAGILIEIEGPPPGLAAGARVPLTLFGAVREGMFLPREAVLYDEKGAYVYKQLAAKDPKGKMRYAAVRVSLLVPYRDGWLVQGVDDDDDIVVKGAGVLWSLEGVGARAADDDEDED
jgi:hypothetical protein